MIATTIRFDCDLTCRKLVVEDVANLSAHIDEIHRDLAAEIRPTASTVAQDRRILIQGLAGTISL